MVGADGPTHHGVLDLSYLREVPGMVVAAPRDGEELRDLLWTALSHEGGPFAFRFPRDAAPAKCDPGRRPKILPVGSQGAIEVPAAATQQDVDHVEVLRGDVFFLVA